MNDALGHLTLQFLAWVGERRRTYDEVMDAWRTSCPRMPVWENAVDDGLVRINRGAVELTAQGLAMLGQNARAA